MVNTANVKSLLLRLHQETQPGATAMLAGSTMPSFASSLGSAIVAAAGEGQSADSLPSITQNAEGIPAKQGLPSEEKVSSGDAVVDDVSAPVQLPKACPDLEVNVTRRAAAKYLARSESTHEKSERKDISQALSADEESKPIGKSGKDKVQKADGQESKSGSLSAVEAAAGSPVTAETVVLQQASVAAPAVAVAPVSQQDQSQLSSDIRNSTCPAATKATTVARPQMRAQRVSSEQKAAAKGGDLVATDKHEGVSESSSSLQDLPSSPSQLKQTVGHDGVVQSTAQSTNAQANLQANHVSASQVSVSSAAVYAEKSVAPTVSLQQSSNLLSHSEEAAVHFQAGMGVSNTGERMIAATPSSLEVGLSHETHGWLKIRAEMTDAGTVTATLSSASTGGEQMLHRELPAMSSFLSGEHLPLSSLVVHSSSEATGQFTGMDGSSGSGGQAWSGNNGSQDNNRGESMTVIDAGLPLEEGFEGAHSDWGRTGSGLLSVRA